MMHDADFAEMLARVPAGSDAGWRRWRDGDAGKLLGTRDGVADRLENRTGRMGTRGAENSGEASLAMELRGRRLGSGDGQHGALWRRKVGVDLFGMPRKRVVKVNALVAGRRVRGESLVLFHTTASGARPSS